MKFLTLPQEKMDVVDCTVKYNYITFICSVMRCKAIDHYLNYKGLGLYRILRAGGPK